MSPVEIAWCISIILWFIFMMSWVTCIKYDVGIIFCILQWVMLIPMWLFTGFMMNWW